MRFKKIILGGVVSAVAFSTLTATSAHASSAPASDTGVAAFDIFYSPLPQTFQAPLASSPAPTSPTPTWSSIFSEARKVLDIIGEMQVAAKVVTTIIGLSE